MKKTYAGGGTVSGKVLSDIDLQLGAKPVPNVSQMSPKPGMF